jgi:hypothetical protein
VTFEPTVVDAGRRTQPVILTNAGSRTLDVVGASIDVAGAFTVVGDTCSGAPLAPGIVVLVEVQFAPIAVGPASAFVTFRLADGSLVTGELSGEGVPEPTLDLVPAVAGSGQTVTVFGAGFPPGTTVELSRPGSSTLEPITVDVDGTFAHVIVVLPTRRSARRCSASTVSPMRSTTWAEFVVSNRRSASADAALRGGLAGRRTRTLTPHGCRSGRSARRRDPLSRPRRRSRRATLRRDTCWRRCPGCDSRRRARS